MVHSKETSARYQGHSWSLPLKSSLYFCISVCQVPPPWASACSLACPPRTPECLPSHLTGGYNLSDKPSQPCRYTTILLFSHLGLTQSSHAKLLPQPIFFIITLRPVLTKMGIKALAFLSKIFSLNVQSHVHRIETRRGRPR